MRIGAGDEDDTKNKDVAIANAYGNRFCIPLDFELLESHLPFYQSALGDRLEYELTFSSYNKVIKSSYSNASYTIEGISLEFEKVAHPELARMVSNQYSGRFAILYDRVLRHRRSTLTNLPPLWNINLNVPEKSMKGVGLLLLFDWILFYVLPAKPYGTFLLIYDLQKKKQKKRAVINHIYFGCIYFPSFPLMGYNL